MVIEISKLFYLFAAAQALILIAVIIKKRGTGFSEVIMSMTLGSLTITLVHYVLLMSETLNFSSPFADLSAIFWFSISPLLYLLTRALTGKQVKFKPTDVLLFPFSIYLTIQGLLFLCGIYKGLFLLFSDMNTYTLAWIAAYLGNSIFFSFLSLRLLRNAKISSNNVLKTKWLRNFFIVFSLLCALLLVLLIWCVSTSYFIKELEFLILSAFVVFIFVLVFKSLTTSSFLNSSVKKPYGNEGLDEKDLLAAKETLVRFLNDSKSFTNPKLNLSDLKKGTGLSENTISQVFSQAMETNFYAYINTLRINNFKELIEKENAHKMTILGLAEESGFASKASFYRSFKEATGTTPAAYMKARKD